MKLINVLCEYTFPKIQRVTTSRHPSSRSIKKGIEKGKQQNTTRVGSGGYAAVYANPKKTPHEVRKISHSKQKLRTMDGFYFYITELEHYPNNDNPYFPRFSQIKVYKEEDTKEELGKITYSVQMERLFDLSQLSKKEITVILNKIFGEDTEKHRAIHRIDGKNYTSKPNASIDIIITALIEDLSSNKHNIIDKDFINAVKFIKTVQNKHNLSLDIGSISEGTNIMFRRTPYGPQLVFTDPLV